MDTEKDDGDSDDRCPPEPLSAASSTSDDSAGPDIRDVEPVGEWAALKDVCLPGNPERCEVMVGPRGVLVLERLDSTDPVQCRNGSPYFGDRPLTPTLVDAMRRARRVTDELRGLLGGRSVTYPVVIAPGAAEPSQQLDVLITSLEQLEEAANGLPVVLQPAQVELIVSALQGMTGEVVPHQWAAPPPHERSAAEHASMLARRQAQAAATQPWRDWIPTGSDDSRPSGGRLSETTWHDGRTRARQPGRRQRRPSSRLSQVMTAVLILAVIAGAGWVVQHRHLVPGLPSSNAAPSPESASNADCAAARWVLLTQLTGGPGGQSRQSRPFTIQADQQIKTCTGETYAPGSQLELNASVVPYHNPNPAATAVCILINNTSCDGSITANGPYTLQANGTGANSWTITVWGSPPPTLVVPPRPAHPATTAPGPIAASYQTWGNTYPGNLGDCTFAAAANWEQIQGYGSPDPTVIGYEFARAGGSATAGISAPALFQYWEHSGIAGIRIVGTQQLRTDQSNTQNAVQDYQALLAALQFTGNQYVGNMPVTSGSHMVVLDGYTPQGPLVVTWGHTVQMSWQQWETEVVALWQIQH